MHIEGADFDKGGEGLAFQVGKPATESVYRQEVVPIVNSTDAGGGYAAPDLKQSDWLCYTVDADDRKRFAVSARVLRSIDGTLVFTREHERAITMIKISPRSPNGAARTSEPGQSLFYLPPSEQILTERGQTWIRAWLLDFHQSPGRRGDGGRRDWHTD
jgi:hypothetical protein